MNNDDDLPDAVGRLLRQRRATLALAESCTGGSIAAALTAVAGSSDFLWGGAVVYSREAKVRLLGMRAQQLDQQGMVSAPTTAALAAAVRRLAGSSFGLAVTGWAGPRGGAGDDPVGTVYLAIADSDGQATKRLCYQGDRRQVIAQATMDALAWLQHRLLGQPDDQP
ncbi:MAG: CinA family protein [Acidobacteriota bacterium]